MISPFCFITTTLSLQLISSDMKIFPFLIIAKWLGYVHMGLFPSFSYRFYSLPVSPDTTVQPCLLRRFLELFYSPLLHGHRTISTAWQLKKCLLFFPFFHGSFSQSIRFLFWYRDILMVLWSGLMVLHWRWRALVLHCRIDLYVEECRFFFQQWTSYTL